MLTISRDRGAMRPGAHRMQDFLSSFLEQRVLERPAILVTGTNGKGTVAAFLEAAFRSCGLRTGLYTSPHLVRAGERIRVNGVPVAEAVLDSLLRELMALQAETLPDASAFEQVTAAALLHFWRVATDVDVIEIGLGGLLDSTNCLAPQVSVLTSVSLEHTEILGPTEACIAADKAHVSRRNRPLVVGSLSPDAKAAALLTAGRTGAYCVFAQGALGAKYEEIFQQAFARGDFFLRASVGNLRVALAVLSEWERGAAVSLSSEAILEGILRARWPGRFDIRSIEGREVLFDAAHNLAGMHFFLRMLAESPLAQSRFHVVYATLSDKDWRSILSLVAPLAQSLTFTQVHSERAVLASELGSVVASHPNVMVEPSLSNALRSALARPDLPILVIGSIALVGESMEVLGIEPFA